MRDPRLDRLAQVVVRHCAPVRPDDLVTIVGEPRAMVAVEAIYEEVLRAGGHPSFHVRSDRLRELLLRHGSDAQLAHVSPFEAHRLERCDVLIVLIHPLNTRFLASIDPARVARSQAGRRELLATSMRRLAAGSMRYVLTEIPSDAAAQDADMSLADYEDFVYRAGFLHLPDPVAAWRRQFELQEQVANYLRGKRTLRFRVPASDGESGSPPREATDLTVDVSERAWVNCAGGENFPDGEVFSGPRGVDGVVHFNLPAVYLGKEVDGVRLRFVDGRVVDASATKNESHLFAMLDMDAGSRIVGEIAIGTNYHVVRPVRNAFFDEKIGGTFHLALGAGYPQTGNTNESALHWDMVCDLRSGPNGPGGTIHADGELFHQNGSFLVGDWPRA
ncbi:MAG: aminopeptidase [Phycisphaerales bacterium]